MSKYIGFAFALIFFASWVYKKLRPPKISEIKSIPTGVSRWSYVVIGLMLFIGGIFLPFGVTEFATEIRRELEWVPSHGFVTELVPEGTNRGRTTYRARFHYQTSRETGAVDHEVLDPNRTQRPPIVSEAIQVLYDPSNPDLAIIDSFQTRWLLPLTMTVVGLATLFFSLLSIYHILRLQSLSRLGTLFAKRAGGVGAVSVGVGAGEGKLMRTKKNHLFSFRHKRCWSIVVEYTDLTGKKHLATSEPIWEFDPETWAKPEVPVPLAIDRADHGRAWILVQDYFQMCRSNPPKTV